MTAMRNHFSPGKSKTKEITDLETEVFDKLILIFLSLS